MKSTTLQAVDSGTCMSSSRTALPKPPAVGFSFSGFGFFWFKGVFWLFIGGPVLGLRGRGGGLL